MKIKKGDKVKIITGKDRGKTGKVVTSFPRDKKVIVEGLNTVKKSVKPRKEGEKGQIVETPMPVSISNVMLVCPKCDKATRVEYKIEGDKKNRVCKKCNVEL
ncbi:MAG: 50S ribosomal protein L24 [Candidatus Moranbacteria bacterium]|nr:50S ribosomal protein L24 [Candidatus Moranbacteria bacterium]